MRTQILALVVCASSVASAQDTTTRMSAGDVALRTRAEQQLMNSMLVADSLEAQIAQRVASRTQNPAVRELANMLALDHRTHFEMLKALSKDEKVGRATDPADTTPMRTTRVSAQLDSMSAGAFLDQSFVREQILNHEQMIATLKAKRPVAHDDDFEKAIDQTVPVLQKHLDQAKAVQAKLGTGATPPK